MSKVSDNAHYYVAGAGAYYGLSFIFTFYPAFIFSLFICQNIDPESFDPHFAGLIGMVLGYIFLQILIVLQKYEVVAFCYLITLWPFLHQIYWYFNHLDSGIGGTDECFPLPPIDWWPLW